MAVTNRRRLISQLPVVNQTETLQKFFGATVDQLFQPGQAEQLSGLIGRKPSYYQPDKDYYIGEPTALRTKYQLEPTMVSVDSNNVPQQVLFYEDIVNQLRFQGGIVGDQHRLFETDYYSWAPAVDLDKLMNFRRYYWISDDSATLAVNIPKTSWFVGAAAELPDGDDRTAVAPGTTAFALPEPLPAFGAQPAPTEHVVVRVNGSPTSDFRIDLDEVVFATAPAAGTTIEIWRNAFFEQNIIGQPSYTLSGALLASYPALPTLSLTNGMRIRLFGGNAVIAGWDASPWERYPWSPAEDATPTGATNDTFIVQGVGTSIYLLPYADVAEDAQYIVMELGADNPWSTVNRWIHEDTLAWNPVKPSDAARGARPILEFYRDMELMPGQVRATDQQAPLFRLYDNDGNALDDPGVYPGSDFAGSKLFSFAERSGAADPLLGIALRRDAYGQIVMENHLVTRRYSYDGGAIAGFYYYRQGDRFSNDWHVVPFGSQQRKDSDGLYEIPLNLQANPANAQIDYISRNQWFDHFAGIIAAQDGFEGEPFAANNWRDTARDLSRGTLILQHSAPMLKLMLMAATRDLDFMQAIRFNEREYIRFRMKFLQKVNDFYLHGVLSAEQPAETWVEAVLTALTTAKTAEFPFRLTGMAGGEYFIPATPAYLGVAPLWKPEISTDRTYGTPLTVIRGHTGNLVQAFGDFRDNVVLALENRLYDAAPEQFKRGRPLFDLASYLPGKYRQGTAWSAATAYPAGARVNYGGAVYVANQRHTSGDTFDPAVWTQQYSRAEVTQIMRPMFERWTATSGLDPQRHDDFDAGDPFTFNYGMMLDRDGVPLPGHWRGIYRWFYDTPRPHSHPWEMLGFTAKPAWWEATYGAPAANGYPRNAALLWQDLEAGYVRGTDQTDPRYQRPGLSRILPVDDTGALLDPVAVGLVPAPTIQAAQQPWRFGDGAPVEDAWMASDGFGFALTQLGYLMKPARFVEMCWNPARETIAYPGSARQVIDSELRARAASADYKVHGERDGDDYYRASGIQVWLADYVVSQGKDISATFGDAVRGLDVRLGHKMAGFTTADDLQVRAENIAGPIPAEDVTILGYNSPSVREEVYSAVIIEWTGDGFRVFGYDVLNPTFTVLPPDPYGPRSPLSIAPANAAVFPDWRSNTYYPLGTQVRYSETTYVCVKAHLSAQIFESKFWSVSDQQTVTNAGQTVTSYLNGLSHSETVPYGTVMRDAQEIADFLLGYQRWLVSRGWVFDEIDHATGQVNDWALAVKHFLFWTQVPWAPGNVIALSPASARLKFRTDHGVVQNMEQLINGVYPLLDRNGQPIDVQDTMITRLDDELTVTARNSNLFAARLYISEIEHVLLFSNVTIFNDVIYQPIFNLRQSRLRLAGLRTTGWAGRLDAPGYIVTSNTIVPNFEKSVEDIRHIFNIEQSDRKVYSDYARHLLGYQSRDYLKALMFSETPQFEFYQGMIQQKGAPGVFHKLLRSDFVSQGDLLFMEEWALRVGEYGAIENQRVCEFSLLQSDIHRDPQLIVFQQVSREDYESATQPSALDSPYDDRLELYTILEANGNVSADDRWVRRPTDVMTVFPTRDDYAAAEDGLPTAGWVKLTEVTYTLPNFDDLTEFYGGLQTQGATLHAGETIWVYTRGDKFDVLRISETTENGNTLVKSEIDATTKRTVFTLAAPHNLLPGDDFVIAGPTGTVTDYEGIWRVLNAPTADSIMIDDDGLVTAYDFSTEGLIGPPVYRLQSMRFATAAEIDAATPPDGWSEYDTAYVAGAPWSVYQWRNGSWTVKRRQPRKLDTRKMVKALVYSSQTEITKTKLFAQPLVIDRVMIYDPVGGFVPGVAEREIYYKLEYDPAAYNIGSADLDPANAWGAEQAGRLWWDMSTTRYLETELSDLADLADQPEKYDLEMQYRLGYWGRVAPGASVDVYEWVRSPVAPSEWAERVANATGEERDLYSGTVKDAAAPSWVEVTEYDAANRPSTIYYFWVKNRSSTPRVPFRRVPAVEVANLLFNPTIADLAWFAPVAENALIVSGVQRYLNDVSTIMQVTTRASFGEGNVHRQWQLVRRGDDALPDVRFWNKMRDSLVGYDRRGRPVPDDTLKGNARFGNEVRPRQGWFVDPRAARDAFVNAINLIFSRTNIVEQRGALLSDLTMQAPIDAKLIWSADSSVDQNRPLPVGPARPEEWQPWHEYKYRVGSYAARDALAQARVFQHADLNQNRVLVDSGDGWSVWVYDLALQIDPSERDGRWALASAYDRHVTSLAERDAAEPGTRVLVDGSTDSGGFWTLWYREDAQHSRLVRAQAYRTADFWSFADWYASGYSTSDKPTVRYPTILARNVAGTPPVNLVQVDDDGTGHWIWTLYDKGGWTTVAKEKATMLLTADLFATARRPYGVDSYDTSIVANRAGMPDLRALIDKLYTALDPVEVNELFFNMLRYVHAEQDQVDWAFKTSFLFINNFREPLTQTPVAVADQTENLLAFISEVKPYHVKVRDFRRRLVLDVDVANAHALDFDKPPYYDPNSATYRPLSLDEAALLQQLPWRHWYEFYRRTNVDYSANGYDPDAYNPVRRLTTRLLFDRTGCAPDAGADDDTDLQNAAWRIAKSPDPSIEIPGCQMPTVDGGAIAESVGWDTEGWDAARWETKPLDPTRRLTTIDGGEIAGPEAAHEIEGGGLQRPGGPEELAHVTAIDPVVNSFYDNWSPGGPYEVLRYYAGDATTTTWEIGQLPQSAAAVAVFIDGVRLPATEYAVEMMTRTVTLDPRPDSEILVHSFGVASNGKIVRHAFFTGDGATTEFSFPTHALYVDGQRLFVSIDGVVETVADHRIDNAEPPRTINFAMAVPPAEGSLVAAYLIDGAPTTVSHAEFDGSSRDLSVAAPSGVTSPELGIIVEVNGRRLAGPEVYYVTAESGKRVVALNEPVDIAEVSAWKDDERLVLGTIEAWQTLANVDLNNVPTPLPPNATAILVADTYVVLLDVTGDTWETTVLSHGSARWRWDAANDEVLIAEDVPLNADDVISVTTFQNAEVMKLSSGTFYGADRQQFVISHQPYRPQTIWLNLQKADEIGGRRLRHGRDFIYTPIANGWEAQAWDRGFGWDSASPEMAVELLVPLDQGDVLMWTAFGGVEARAPVAWRVITYNVLNRDRMLPTGEKRVPHTLVDAQRVPTETYDRPAPFVERLRISDAHKLRSVDPIERDAHEFELVANPKLPDAFLPSDLLQAPGEQPGVVWITGERIEYFGLEKLDQRRYRLSKLVRGTRGTSTGDYAAGALVIDGNDGQRFTDEVPARLDYWDIEPWDTHPWGITDFYLQQHDEDVVAFLLAASGSYEPTYDAR